MNSNDEDSSKSRSETGLEHSVQHSSEHQLRKALNKVENVIWSIKEQVIKSKGCMYHLDSVEKFNRCLEESDNMHVIKLRKELEKTIKRIMMAGSEDADDIRPSLEVTLDDPVLNENTDLFIQIVNKILATERFYCYQQVQRILNE